MSQVVNVERLMLETKKRHQVKIESMRMKPTPQKETEKVIPSLVSNSKGALGGKNLDWEREKLEISSQYTIALKHTTKVHIKLLGRTTSRISIANDTM